VTAPVRIGLAGYGLGGRYFHAPLLASAPDCEFLGVVTTSPERCHEVDADLAPAFASLEELAGAGGRGAGEELRNLPCPANWKLTPGSRADKGAPEPV
jgi:hypothetical protein